MKPKRRRLKSRPMDLRHAAQRQVIARLLLLGWSGERIARRLGCTARAVRYCIAGEEFRALFAERQKEHYQRIDRRMGALLDAALTTLLRQLKHADWRAGDSAAEKILRMHGKYIEKLDILGRVDHHHSVSELPEIVMSDETRTKARELLALWRQHQPRPELPPRLTQQNGGQDDEASDSD